MLKTTGMPCFLQLRPLVHSSRPTVGNRRLGTMRYQNFRRPASAKNELEDEAPEGRSESKIQQTLADLDALLGIEEKPEEKEGEVEKVRSY